MGHYIDAYAAPLSALVDLFDDKLFDHPVILFLLHPVILFLLNLQWNLFGFQLSVVYQTFDILTLVMYMLGFIILNSHVTALHGQYASCKEDSPVAFYSRLARRGLALFMVPRAGQNLSGWRCNLFYLVCIFPTLGTFVI